MKGPIPVGGGGASPCLLTPHNGASMQDERNTTAGFSKSKVSNFYNQVQKKFPMHVLFTGLPEEIKFFVFFSNAWVAQPQFGV